MTILMTIIGVFVFIISLIPRGFKVAVKRLMVFVLIGFVIDLLIAAFTFLVIYLSTH